MKQVTDAQRDSRKVWTYLERLFDWAGTRNKQMPSSDLVIIRDQVTEALDRIVDRADSLERAPLLREVLSDEDGTKTVVIDMRDGTTRRFQTRVDWFDKSATLGDPDPLRELREELASQVMLTQSENALARSYEEEARSLEELLMKAEEDLSMFRDERSEYSDLLAGAEGELASARAERDHWQSRYTELFSTTSELLTQTTTQIDQVIASARDKIELLQ